LVTSWAKVSMRLQVSGPVSSIFCIPKPTQRLVRHRRSASSGIPRTLCDLFSGRRFIWLPASGLSAKQRDGVNIVERFFRIDKTNGRATKSTSSDDLLVGEP
jgi:hypothetical protein